MSRDRVAATRYLVGGGKEGGSHRRDGKGQGVRCGAHRGGTPALAPTAPLCDAGGLTAPLIFVNSESDRIVERADSSRPDT